jgi:GT2 family glycosyltransferase
MRLSHGLSVRPNTSPPRFTDSAPVELGRVRVAGKLFRLGSATWQVKGLTYGPFAPNHNQYLPERPRVLSDFAHMRRLGANCVRVYHVPTPAFLDDALDSGLRVFVDIPWEKHRCFMEDWAAQEEARRRVRATARQIGAHPGVFALSVANEIPKDVVRFYGAQRVVRFVEELLDAVKQEVPECLVTYTNYPSTEFLVPARQDFYCANVYLEDGELLGRYLDRLQHVAGSLPLVLGEYGLDSFRHGTERQADVLRRHVQAVVRHGLAGSFVFSYTDDWYTGGHQIQDWGFGITEADRTEKPSAGALAKAWSNAGADVEATAPRVSVVVCCYNGAATLRECLESLIGLDYPDYEVIVVDDGSTDRTADIAAGFPSVKLLRQANLGLSAARNAGALAATGEIVAYTDADCVADESWLAYLVRAMREQKVDAIGGPNLPPPSDQWTARCVAASPGGPSHVMLDDVKAEHVPGCNMAFDRRRLLALGGFDRRFRVAGDDVDVCWRFLDAGMQIGYAPAALVWHHRRNTARAYLRQQRGYGEAEAVLRFKHPRRFNGLGCSRWRGVIYGEGAVGLPVCAPAVYHGRFGSGLFQSIYHRQDYSLWGYLVLLEWHALAAVLLVMSLVVPQMAMVALGMWCASLVAAARSARRAPLPPGAPWWCRPLVFLLHLLQPVVRAWHRAHYRLRMKRLPRTPRVAKRRITGGGKNKSLRARDLWWTSSRGRGREHFLEALQLRAACDGWVGDFDDEWQDHDVELLGDSWHDLRVRTATEELGGPRRFTRVRCTLHWTCTTLTVGAAVAAWTIAALTSGKQWAEVVSLVLLLGLAVVLERSRRRCLLASAWLLWRAGQAAGLEPYTLPPAPARALPGRKMEHPVREMEHAPEGVTVCTE